MAVQPMTTSRMLLPVYVVADESASMAPCRTALAGGLRSLCDGLGAEPALAARLRLAVRGFSDDVQVRLPLRDARSLPGPPEVAIRGARSYTAAFTDLLTSIPADVQALKDSGHRVQRPVVFFLSGGEPSDPDLWRAAHQRLTDRSRTPAAPNIVACGVGYARAATVGEVATRREFALIAAPGTGAGAAITEFFRALTADLLASARALGSAAPHLVVSIPPHFRLATGPASAAAAAGPPGAPAPHRGAAPGGLSAPPPVPAPGWAPATSPVPAPGGPPRVPARGLPPAPSHVPAPRWPPAPAPGPARRPGVPWGRHGPGGSARPLRRRAALMSGIAAAMAVTVGLAAWLTWLAGAQPAIGQLPFKAALAALASAPEVHYRTATGGDTADIQVTVAGDVVGTITHAGQPYQLLQVNGQFYVKPPAAAVAKPGSAEAAALGGKWLTGRLATGLVGWAPSKFPAPAQLAAQLTTALGRSPARDPGTRVDGVPVLAASTPRGDLYVSKNAPYRVVSLVPTASAAGDVAGFPAEAGIAGNEAGFSAGAEPGATQLAPVDDGDVRSTVNALTSGAGQLSNVINTDVSFNMQGSAQVNCSEVGCQATDTDTTSVTGGSGGTGPTGTVSADLIANFTIEGEPAGSCQGTAQLPVNGTGQISCSDGGAGAVFSAADARDKAQAEADGAASGATSGTYTVRYAVDDYVYATAEIAVAQVAQSMDQQLAGAAASAAAAAAQAGDAATAQLDATEADAAASNADQQAKQAGCTAAQGTSWRSGPRVLLTSDPGDECSSASEVRAEAQKAEQAAAQAGMQAGEREISQGAVTFGNDAEAASFGASTWNQTVQNLPYEVREALRDYSMEPGMGNLGPTYLEINRYLRGQSPASPAVQAAISKIDQAVAARPVPEDIVVTRTLPFSLKDMSAPPSAGARVPDAGYMSTSIGPPAPGFGNKAFIFHLRVPKGTPGIYIDKISGKGERELLLGRGLRYEVVRVVPMPGGRQWQIYAKILPRRSQ